jgi:hypothetical protein
MTVNVPTPVSPEGPTRRIETAASAGASAAGFSLPGGVASAGVEGRVAVPDPRPVAEDASPSGCVRTRFRGEVLRPPRSDGAFATSAPCAPGVASLIVSRGAVAAFVGVLGVGFAARADVDNDAAGGSSVVCVPHQHAAIAPRPTRTVVARAWRTLMEVLSECRRSQPTFD